jgi:hypothetical protein
MLKAKKNRLPHVHEAACMTEGSLALVVVSEKHAFAEL